jgi:hypothetical protein
MWMWSPHDLRILMVCLRRQRRFTLLESATGKGATLVVPINRAREVASLTEVSFPDRVTFKSTPQRLKPLSFPMLLARVNSCPSRNIPSGSNLSQLKHDVYSGDVVGGLAVALGGLEANLFCGAHGGLVQPMA